jgi:hypothetical protein
MPADETKETVRSWFSFSKNDLGTPYRKSAVGATIAVQASD